MRTIGSRAGTRNAIAHISFGSTGTLVRETQLLQNKCALIETGEVALSLGRTRWTHATHVSTASPRYTSTVFSPVARSWSQMCHLPPSKRANRM